MKVTTKQHHQLATHLSRQSLITAALAASVLAISAASAQSTQPSQIGQPAAANAATMQAQSSPSAAQNLITTNEAGSVVAIDRQTGQMRPLTAAEAQTLALGIKELLNQSTDGLVQVRRADGSVSIDLQGRFQNVTLARKESDGSIVQACVDSPENAAVFFDIDATLVSTLKRAMSRPARGPLETQ